MTPKILCQPEGGWHCDVCVEKNGIDKRHLIIKVPETCKTCSFIWPAGSIKKAAMDTAKSKCRNSKGSCHTNAYAKKALDALGISCKCVHCCTEEVQQEDTIDIVED